MGVSDADITQYEGEAYFYIGYAYGMLAFHWGDAILDKTGMTLDEAYTISRSPKSEVLAYSYECLDKAANVFRQAMPAYKGYKGRRSCVQSTYCLWNGDYETAATAAKAVWI